MKMYLYLIISVLIKVTIVQCLFEDYFGNVFSYFNAEKETRNDLIDFQKKVPYELSVTDEKFIADAIKLLGVGLSELDSCQHRVVLQLQTSCHKMNEEQLAKMAVMLLNCQSAVEGRRLYPCTESMNLKDCTAEMDSITWNTYHIMSNRARAVCYYVRNVQFRGLTEQTVNQLMDSAREQILKLQEMSEEQKNIQHVAEETKSTITQGYVDLTRQQDDFRKAYLYSQLAMEDNINRLADEKFLIKESKDLLADMTDSLNNKLEDAIKQLDVQSEQNNVNHKELIEDLLRIQKMANGIFKQIDDSSKLLMQQNQHAMLQYNLTVQHLREINNTVHSLVSLMDGMKQAFEDRLAWITDTLGGTDYALERLYSVLWHLALLVGVMIVCAFLNASNVTRIAVFVLLPINLALRLNNSEQSLDAIGLIVALAAFVLVQTAFFFAIKLKKSNKIKMLTDENGIKVTPIKKKLDDLNKNDDETDYFDENNTTYENNFISPTPPLSSLNGFSRSRSRTPLLNRSLKSPCQGITRMGTPCKLSVLVGRDYCYRHQNGDSIMG